jgi:2-polyprenyl-3-methyl-5-hydroxy-6-metoxy-1,4-benzoquinol methylase
MDHRDVGRYWEGNAFAWTVLARQGWDVYRDVVNLPAFLELLPDIAGKKGLDVGCGEGHNTRRFAERGARMSAIDIAPTFVRHAAGAERDRSLNIGCAVASALDLPFVAGHFDFVTAVMSLMDMPNHVRTWAENSSCAPTRRIFSVLDSTSLLFSAAPPACLWRKPGCLRD